MITTLRTSIFKTSAPLTLLRLASTQKTPSIATPSDKVVKKDTDTYSNTHFKTSSTKHPLGIKKVADRTDLFYKHPSSPVWTPDELSAIEKTHREPKDLTDRIALKSVKVARWSFDTFSGYRFGKLTPSKVFNRAIFLETIAGCPGMAAGMLRHLKSLRSMKRDHGWIHTLLEEAENERMHLMTFIKLKNPSKIFRFMVIMAQGVFMNAFFLCYIFNPRFCHRFVGYLEEEAVKTYSDILAAIEDGRLEGWKTAPAPEIAIDYWHLDAKATMVDLIRVIRADESNHRDVNHVFANLKADAHNPYIVDKSKKEVVTNYDHAAEKKTL